MIKVNLVPAEVLIAEQKKRRVAQAAAVGVVLLLIFAGISLLHWNTARGLESQLKHNEEELAKLQKIVEQVKQLEATAKAVQNRLNVIENLLTGRFLYTVFMDDWIRSLPPGVWLTSLNTSGGTGGLSVNTAGSARQQTDVAEWIRTLEGAGKFSNVELGPLSLAGAPPDATYGFSIRTTYKFTPPKEVKPN